MNAAHNLRGQASSLDLIRAQWARWAPIPLRLIVGYGFMAHGVAKILKGPDNFAAILHAIGTPLPTLMSWATIVVELVGGAAMILGAFVVPLSIPMVIVLLTAVFTVHLPYGFSSINLQSFSDGMAHFGQPGYECDLLYVACIVALVLGGSGPYALDNVWGSRLRTFMMSRRA